MRESKPEVSIKYTAWIDERARLDALRKKIASDRAALKKRAKKFREQVPKPRWIG